MGFPHKPQTHRRSQDWNRSPKVVINVKSTHMVRLSQEKVIRSYHDSDDETGLLGTVDGRWPVNASGFSPATIRVVPRRFGVHDPLKRLPEGTAAQLGFSTSLVTMCLLSLDTMLCIASTVTMSPRELACQRLWRRSCH